MSSSVLLRPRSAPAAEPRNAARFRPDIQGLRAVAVGVVVLYHLFPGVLRGGFVGVDVFFVISGYLITGHLARDVAARGSVDLLGFYARRARRLVPAATVVLAVTWVASLVVLPTSRLASTAAQVVASALYAQNWVLAHNSVNYLTAEDAASPVQHYWSLAVEEQFYLGWPLLLILTGVLARLLRWTWRRTALALGAAACALSIAASLLLTASNGPAAYFVTETRVWELGAGALLALLGRRGELPAGLSPVARGIGLAAIAGSALLYSGATPFPGAAALVPVLGSVLVLSAGANAPHARLLRTRPMVWVGDHSYALYLVHWPLVVLWKAYSGGDIGLLDGPAVLAASLALSWLLTRFVEDPVRRSRVFASRGRGLAVALAAVVPLVLALPHLFPETSIAAVTGPHPGAAVLAGDSAPVTESIATMTPRPEAAQTDSPDYRGRGCHVEITTPGARKCVFGETHHPRLTVALVGDSKIGQWFPAMEEMATRHHWRLVTYMRSRCPWTATQTIVGAGDESAYTLCHAWGEEVLTGLKADLPDVVLTSDRPAVGVPAHPEADRTSFAAIAGGMPAYWQQMLDRGVRVIAIRETPEMVKDIPDCLSTPSATIARCSKSRRSAVADDTPNVLATRAMHGRVPLIDMTDLICGPRTCSPVVGDVLVYRDTHHLTRTYVMSLEPYLEQRLLDAGVPTTP